MKSKLLFALIVLVVAIPFAAAQRPAGSKITGDAYRIHSGSMYTRHARDHAQFLRRYSSEPGAISAPAIQQHAAAVRQNVEAARGQLKQVKPKDDEAKRLIEALEADYAACIQHCDKMDGAAGDEKEVAACCANMVKALDLAQKRHSQLMKKQGVEPLTESDRQPAAKP